MRKALSPPGSGAFDLPVAAPAWHYRIGCLALLGLAAAHGLRAPDSHGPAALALGLALALDGLSRLATDAASRRTGIVVAMPGRRSPVLALTGTPLVPAACLALLTLADLARFPVAASLIAGLTAMAALARLALARTVLAAGRLAAGEPETR